MLPDHSHFNKIFCFWIALLAGCFYFSCQSPDKKPKQDQKSDDAFAILYPYGFDSLKFPTDNHINKFRVELGRKLFFDPRFSSDKKISCATCHKPEFAFADTIAFHKGAHDRLNARNTPSLLNIGYHPYFDFDGGVPSLELQALVPVEGEKEMNTNLLKMAELMQVDQQYLDLSQKAYHRKPDPFVIVRALASFQRSLVSKGSRYDLYLKSGGKKGLHEEEILGMNLFFSARTQCSQCHSGFLFTNFKFENIGIINTTSDSGRYRVTGNIEDYGKFKVPSLRNVAQTPPYMHDGSIKDLEAVMDFYIQGGVSVRNKSPLIKPLDINPQEKKAILAFLRSLNDTI